MRTSIQVLLLIFLTMQVFVATAEELIRNPFSTGVIQLLYPQDNSIQIHTSTNWQNLVYVAQSHNSVYQLDVWNMTNINHPVKTDSVVFGSPSGSRVPFIPVALLARDSVLLIQANRLLYTFRQSNNGHLSLIDTLDFRFEVESNEAQQLYTGGSYGSMIQYSTITRSYDQHLIGLTSLTDPTWVRWGGTLPGPVNGSFNGQPILFNNGLTTNPFVCSTLETDSSLDHHIDQFWQNKIDASVSADMKNKTLSEVIEQISSEIDYQQVLTEALSSYFALTGLDRMNLEHWIIDHYPMETDLNLILSEQSLSLDDPFSMAIRKLVHKGFDQSINACISEQLYGKVLLNLLSGLFPMLEANKQIDAFYSDMEALFKADYQSVESTIIDYSTNKLLKPLLNQPDCLDLTVNQLIDRLDKSEATRELNLLLEVTDAVIETGMAIPDFFSSLLGLDLGAKMPDCMDWPESVREFMELMLYHNQAGINPDGKVWFELVKYIAYINGIDFASQMADIDKQISSFLKSAAKGYSDHVLAPFNLNRFSNATLAEAISGYSLTLSATAPVEEALVDLLCSQFYAIGISPETSLGTLLTNLGLPMKFDIQQARYIPQATLSDLLKAVAQAPVVHPGYGHYYQGDFSEGLFFSSLSYQNSALLLQPNARQNTYPGMIGSMRQATTEVLLGFAEDIFGTSSFTGSINDLMAYTLKTRFDLGHLIGEQLHLIFKDLFDSAFGIKGYMSVVEDYDRAIFEGDCVSQWQMFLETARLASVLLDPTSFSSIMSTAMDEALIQAYDMGINYLFTSVLGEFIDGVKTRSEGDWRSWMVRLNEKKLCDNIFPLTNSYGNLFDIKMDEDNLYAVYIKRTDDYSNNKLATLLTREGLLSPHPVSRTFDLGKWRTIDFFSVSQKMMWISGELFFPADDAFPDGCALAVDFNQEPVQAEYIPEKGYHGIWLTASREFSTLMNGQYLMVTAPNQVLILPNTFKLKLNTYDTANPLPRNQTTGFRVYPNPARQLIRVDGFTAGTPLILLTTSGTEVGRYTDSPIDISRIENGCYLLRSGQEVTKLIINKR